MKSSNKYIYFLDVNINLELITPSNFNAKYHISDTKYIYI